MSEIEKYYNGEIHVDFDNEIEELKADIEEYRDSTTWWSNRFNAVERDNRELKKTINGMIDNEEKYLLEINKLKSIIKEVREYIEKNSLYEQDYDYDYEENLYEYPPNDEQARKDILEILDKENK